MKKYLTEFVGTFLLVLVFLVAGNVPASSAFLPIGYGGLLIALTWSGLEISGAHYNPAISFAAFLRGNIDKIDAIYYILCQLGGALLAAMIGSLLLGAQGVTDLNPHSTPAFAGLLCELIGTFAIAYTWLSTISNRRGNTVVAHGMAMGVVLPGLMYAFSGISVALFNPALALGCILLSVVSGSDWWLYLLGSAMGAAAAATFVMNVGEE